VTATPPRAAGFIPAAPLLVPQVAGGSASLDEEMREACRTVARRLTESAGTIVVAASVSGGGSWAEETTWGFEGFGVTRAPADDRPRLPWQLGIGAWLLDEIGWNGPRRYLAIDAERPMGTPVSPDCAVLVVGDASARRADKAPGHLDERAAGFDATVATALASGDVAGLGGLDASLAVELMCTGAPAWRWLAATVGAQPVIEADLLVDVAPYGVGYVVAYWRLSDSDAARAR
jgi:hypothetical protein